MLQEKGKEKFDIFFNIQEAVAWRGWMFCSKCNFMLIPYLENDNNNKKKIKKGKQVKFLSEVSQTKF